MGTPEISPLGSVGFQPAKRNPAGKMPALPGGRDDDAGKATSESGQNKCGTVREHPPGVGRVHVNRP